MTVSVRQVELGDKTSWLDLYFAYLKFYETEPDELATELAWQRLTALKPEIQGLVAEENGEIVGIAHFHFQLTTWSKTGHCYLEDLYVKEGSRGKGVATALISEVKRLAIRQECAELFWITKESNQTARKLYDKVATKSDFVRYEILLDE